MNLAGATRPAAGHQTLGGLAPAGEAVACGTPGRPSIEVDKQITLVRAGNATRQQAVARRFASVATWAKNLTDPHKLALAGLGVATLPWHALTQLGAEFCITGRGPLSYLTSLGLWGDDFSGKTVLDVGCGACLFALCANIAYADTGTIVAAMDLDIPPLTPFGVRGNGMHANFKDGTFDLIISNWLFPHLQSYFQATKFIDEMLRMAKPGGEIRIGLAPHFPSHPRSHWISYLKNHPAVADVELSPGILPLPGLPAYFSAKLKPQAVTDAELAEYALKLEGEVDGEFTPWRRQFINGRLLADFESLAASPNPTDQQKALVLAKRINFNSGDDRVQTATNQILVEMACRQDAAIDIQYFVLKYFLLTHNRQDYAQVLQALPPSTRIELYNRMALDDRCSEIIVREPKLYFVHVPDTHNHDGTSSGIDQLKKHIEWERELQLYQLEEKLGHNRF